MEARIGLCARLNSRRYRAEFSVRGFAGGRYWKDEAVIAAENTRVLEQGRRIGQMLEW